MAGDSTPQTPTTGSSGIGDWVKAFAVQRKWVKQGIRDGLSKDDRAARLAEADAALPDVELPDSDDLQRIADLLEDKLQEMLDVVLGNGDPDRRVRLPSDFDPGPAPQSLRDAQYKDERLWLFKGGIQEILYRFRDQGSALVMTERKRLLKALSARVQGLEQVIGELNAHPVVAQALEADDVRQIEQTLEAARTIATRYKSILTSPEEGVAPLLEANHYRLQGQFTAACAQLCLQLYGNVSNLHLRELLSLKALHIHDVRAWFAPTAPPTEAERKRLERKRDLMLTRVMSRAKKESWPTWPILQLYNYDTRFGRLRTKVRAQRDDDGQSSVETPTDRAGVPLAGGW